jgi:glycosyltransferase involved in cell wall biosynthesis
MRIEIWHNILWSKYKGEVFTALWNSADRREFELSFTQIAETDAHRKILSGVEVSRHRYPFELLFRGSFQETTLRGRLRAILPRTLRSDADLTILSGYERLDCWLQMLVLVLRGRKVALFLDSTINDRRQRFVAGLLKTVFFKAIDGIFGYGTRTKEYAVHYGARPEKVFIPCQAAALSTDYSPEIALQRRKQAEIRESAPRFVYIGRLSAEKGLSTLIDAFALVHAELKDASLVIVGDGAMRGELEQRGKAHHLSSAISFTGSKTGESLYEEFTRATALILPSVSEPWGLVVNEALAYGCPAIVSDRCGCVPELLIEGKTGLLHRAGDAQDLADKMRRAPALFRDLEFTAIECLRVISRYTPNQAAHQILDGCRRILGRAAQI